MERPKNISDEQWNVAQQIYESAKRQGDKYPDLTVAQAALETGWFKKPSGSFNYFGQKASKSQKGTALRTQEVADNRAYTTSQKFRDYSSIDEAVADRINKWGSKYKDASNVEDALSKIWRYDEKKGSGVGYATDVSYGKKVKTILNQLGTDVSTTAQPTTEAERRAFLAPTDFSTLEYQGQTFGAEEKEEETSTEEKEGTVAAKELMEDTFMEDLQKLMTAQPQQQAQQDFTPQEEIPQIDIATIEYQPIQTEFQEGGSIPITPNGVYEVGKRNVIVPTSDGRITMSQVPYSILGIDEFGNSQMMHPNGEYKFPGNTILEIPQIKRFK